MFEQILSKQLRPDKCDGSRKRSRNDKVHLRIQIIWFQYICQGKGKEALNTEAKHIEDSIHIKEICLTRNEQLATKIAKLQLSEWVPCINTCSISSCVFPVAGANEVSSKILT